MDIHNIRLQLRQKTIYEVPLRVTFYARVSTDSQEQLNSLTNQISYYEEMIKKNSAWTYVPGYIDEGLSGISTKKREHFHRMIDDAKAGKFDLILTKEISRFARNTLDSIQYTRDLLNAGVAVFFQNDNIKTIDEDSELRLSIMSSIAQDELRKLSSRVKFGHQQAIKEGVVLGNNRIFGYLKDDGRLVIDETEAPMVRQLFELYASGEYSMKQIEKIFWDQGYRNYRGNRIAHTTMSNMISNPKYKGYYVGNKVKVIDMFTKKQKFLPPEEWVMFKDETGEIVPAIVSEELWDQANAVLRRRSDDVKNRQNVCNSENLLTSKLYCTCCGTPYYRKESKSRKGVINSKWICSGKIKNGAHTCDSIPLYESELKPILLEVFQDTKVDTEALIAKYTAMHAELTGNAVIQKEIATQKQIIELEQQKKSKLLGYNVSGRISDRDFIAMTDQCNADIKKAEETLQELEEQMQSNEEFQKHMAKIRAVMREAQKCVESGFITKAFVDQYIDKIFATPEADGTVRLDIRIFTGEATEKYLEKLKVRSGQINHPVDRPEESSTATTAFGDGGRPGQMSKPINPANACKTGVLSALMAREGIQAPDKPFEGVKGFYKAFADKVRYEEIIKDLDYSSLLIDTAYIKLYPACRHLHPPVDAGAALRQRPEFQLDRIQKIQIHIYPNSILVTGKIRKPVSADEAKFSMTYALACALQRGTYTLEDLSAASSMDQTTADLIDKMEIIPDPSCEIKEKNIRGCRVQLHMQDGSVMESFIPVPKGDPEHPLEEADIWGKVVSCCQGIYDDETQQALYRVILKDSSLDLAQMYALLHRYTNQ